MKLKNIILSLALMSGSLAVSAQTLPILGMNPDARSMAMGGNYYGEANGNYLYTNATSLLYKEHKLHASLGGMLRPDLDKFYYGQVNAAYRLGRHGIYAGFRYWGGPEFKPEMTASKKSIMPNEWSVDAGYAFRLDDHFSATVSGSFLQSTLKKTAYTASFNAAAFYRNDFGMGKYVVGVNGGNFGPNINYTGKGDGFSLPAYAGAGGEIQLNLSDDHRINGSLGAQYFFMPAENQMFTANVGAEYCFQNMISARAGYAFGSMDNSVLAFGLGGAYGGFTLDAAYQMGLGGNPAKTALLTLGFSL